MTGLRIERVSIIHPDAARLVEDVQAEYVMRYGGADDTPMDPTMFVSPQGAFFVGYLDDVALATGAWRFRDDVTVAFEHLRKVEIKRMYVAAAARRTGLARTMLGHLEETARVAGAEAVILETGLAQPEAIALYLSAGYAAVPGFGHYKDAPVSRCFGKVL